jgi:hypothetical protein
VQNVETYRAISLWQPYASLVALGYKPIETRLWPTPYRGDFLVCATKAPAPREDYDRVLGRLRTRCVPTYGQLEPESSPKGVALCLVTLLECRPMTEADEEDAWVPYLNPKTGKPRWAWVLGNRRPVTWTPVSGKQGWFNVPKASITLEVKS